MKNKTESKEGSKYALLGVPAHRIVENLQDKDVGKEKEILNQYQETIELFKKSAAYDKTTEKGKAIEQLNLLFFSCMKIQDFKTALSVRKELNDLLKLKEVNKEIKSCELVKWEAGNE